MLIIGNMGLIDMTTDAVKKRKELRERERLFAETIWNEMGNEGDENEKEYWIHGFVTALKYELE